MNGGPSSTSTSSVRSSCGSLDVDERVAVVVEDAEEAVDADVDARRLEQGIVVRIDLDAAFLQAARDRAVGEDHGADSTADRPLLVFHTLPTRYVLQPVDPNVAPQASAGAKRSRRRHRRRLIAVGALAGAHRLRRRRRGDRDAHPGHKTVRAAARAPQALGAAGAPTATAAQEVRGVHVTMALAGLTGKIDAVHRAEVGGPQHDRARRQGRERRGRVPGQGAARARKVGSARPYYDARASSPRSTPPAST